MPRRGGRDHFGTEKLVTITEIREIHRLAMSAVWKVEPHPDATPAEQPGGFREHDIRPFSGAMLLPSWTDVSAQLTAWVDRVNAMGTKIAGDVVTPTEFALALAEMHSAFERIHPFLDGNGRTGRLVLNLLLVRLGLPPTIIFKRDRERYLESLDQADRGEPGRLAELLARSLSTICTASPCRTSPARPAWCRCAHWRTPSSALRRCVKRHDAADWRPTKARTVSGGRAGMPWTSTKRFGTSVPADRRRHAGGHRTVSPAVVGAGVRGRESAAESVGLQGRGGGGGKRWRSAATLKGH